MVQRKLVNEKVTREELGRWLWGAACKIRGPVDAPKYKDFILPLIFLKRLSDVFDEEIEKLAKEYGDNNADNSD
jgi:type I restriction enzyme M protein